MERKLRIGHLQGLFAEAKQYHGLRRARYRRLNNVSIQALMTALAQNIKRITKLMPGFYWIQKIVQIFQFLLKGIYCQGHYRKTPENKITHSEYNLIFR